MKQSVRLTEDQLKSLIKEAIVENLNQTTPLTMALKRYGVCMEELTKYIGNDRERAFDLAVLSNNLRGLGQCLQQIQ